MAIISIEEYRELIRIGRKKYFKTPYDLVYDEFVKLGYDKKNNDYFFNNASELVEKLRKNCWDEYQPLEKKFTSEMLISLIDEDLKKKMSELKPLEAVIWFVEKFPEHIYNLTLSNTQSRRSRAGKEFESIIELILIGAEIPLDSQGNIGKSHFVKKGLGKLVDIVCPGVMEYSINKRNTVLISAKTTLRERWQEVPEEMGRTGAREMFLATLDTAISDDVLNTLYEANIQVTTTKNIKESYYKTNPRVLSFETLLKICKEHAEQWETYPYTVEESTLIYETEAKQAQKHSKHKFVENYYSRKK